MLKIIFAGAVLGTGAVATALSGDLSVGTGTALACTFGAVSGGATGFGLSFLGMRLRKKEPSDFLVRHATAGAIAGAALASVIGYNSMIEPTEPATKNATLVTSHVQPEKTGPSL